VDMRVARLVMNLPKDVLQIGKQNERLLGYRRAENDACFGEEGLVSSAGNDRSHAGLHMPIWELLEISTRNSYSRSLDA